MKYYLLSFILIEIFTQNSSRKATKTTLPLRERIEALRTQLKDEIKQQIFENESDDKYAFSDENYDFINNHGQKNYHDDTKITPIMDSNFRKRQLKKKKSESVTVPANTELSNVTEKSKLSISHRQLRSKIKKKKAKVKMPLEIFYRREFNDEMLHKQIPWVHCHYMVMPYLTGLKKDVTNLKEFGPKDPTVVRLIQLLSINTMSLSKEDIYSILYQISHLQIRLFQWDVVPIKMLLNVVIKEKNHSFRTLKHGIQNLFAEWKLDISNATSLLKQTRLFRPPCVRVSDIDGSTKSPRVTHYPKKETQSTKCDRDDDDESDIK